MINISINDINFVTVKGINQTMLSILFLMRAKIDIIFYYSKSYL